MSDKKTNITAMLFEEVQRLHSENDILRARLAASEVARFKDIHICGINSDELINQVWPEYAEVINSGEGSAE